MWKWGKKRSSEGSSKRKEEELHKPKPKDFEERINSFLAWSKANDEMIQDLQRQCDEVQAELSSCKSESSVNLLQVRLAKQRNEITQREERRGSIQHGMEKLIGEERQRTLRKTMKNASIESLETVVTNAHRIETDFQNVIEKLRDACVLADKWADKWNVEIRDLLYVQLGSLEKAITHLDTCILQKRLELFLKKIRNLRREARTSRNVPIAASTIVGEVLHDIDGIRHVVTDMQQSAQLPGPQAASNALQDIDNHIKRYRTSRISLYEDTLHKMENALTKVEDDLSTSLHSTDPLY